MFKKFHLRFLKILYQWEFIIIVVCNSNCWCRRTNSCVVIIVAVSCNGVEVLSEVLFGWLQLVVCARVTSWWCVHRSMSALSTPSGGGTTAQSKPASGKQKYQKLDINSLYCANRVSTWTFFQHLVIHNNLLRSTSTSPPVYTYIYLVAFKTVLNMIYWYWLFISNNRT